MGADVIGTDFDIITHLGGCPATGQSRLARRLIDAGVARTGTAGGTDAGKYRRHFIFIGLIVHLNPIEGRFRKGHRGQRRSYFTAYGYGQVMLPLLIGGYNQIGEEVAEFLGLE